MTVAGSFGSSEDEHEEKCDAGRPCGGISNVAGPQSYVELLTCLQIAKDVKGLSKE